MRLGDAAQHTCCDEWSESGGREHGPACWYVGTREHLSWLLGHHRLTGATRRLTEDECTCGEWTETFDQHVADAVIREWLPNVDPAAVL